MARYSKAYSSLMNRLDEIETLLKLARNKSRLLPNPQSNLGVSALCRSGVVLLSGHIEGYIEDLGTLALDNLASRGIAKASLAPGFRYFLSKDLITDIGRVHEPKDIVAKIDQLFHRDGHLWDRQLKFAPPFPTDVFIGSFSNPTHDRIAKFFSRFGYSDFRQDLLITLAVDAAACVNMINQVVDQRNRIAHGDTVTTSTPMDLALMLEFARKYCRQTDSLFCTWLASLGCPIR